jgi:hydroxyethylthiazole kinase-like uncharacterized protein yjeF
MKILSVAQTQVLERQTNDSGNTFAMMMDRAGKGVAEIISRHTTISHPILILVGPGNNGGDGLVAARDLHERGFSVTTYLSRQRDSDNDTVFANAKNAGVPIIVAQQDSNYDTLKQLSSSAVVIVDALLGTGSRPPIKGTIASILSLVHESLKSTRNTIFANIADYPEKHYDHTRIIAVDGPSGLDFDTGEVDEQTLHADITVTFASPKWGQLHKPGSNFTGKLVVVDIGTQDDPEIDSNFTFATAALIQSWLPERPPDAHKGTFGRAMLVAGSANYTGAAILSATSCLRAGAGLVTLAIPANLHSAIVPAIPEATYLLLPHTTGVLNEQSVAVLRDSLKTYNTLLIGPGMGNTPETRLFIQTLLFPASRMRRTGFVPTQIPDAAELPALPPMIIDADGLNILAQIPDWQKILPEKTIMTPHPGEMSRLTGLSTKDINTNRYRLALESAQQWNQIVVLKGAHTVVASPEGSAVVMPFANPGLSTAGTGDVLAGTIAAMLAQGLSPFKAAVTGAYIHGMSGEICREKLGSAGMIAGDVASEIAEVLRRFE